MHSSRSYMANPERRMHDGDGIELLARKRSKESVRSYGSRTKRHATEDMSYVRKGV